jgi:hypothetical protein
LDSRVAEVEEVFAPVVNFDTGFLFWGRFLNCEKLHHQ